MHDPADHAPAVIRARGLRKTYGDGRDAVAGIDVEVHAGECFGFLGPNGAGKSTVMRMLYGFSPPTAGSLEVLGMDVARHPRRVKARLGVVPQANNLDPDNTVIQNLRIYARYFDIPRRVADARAREVLDLFQLGERADAQIHELSGGMKRRLVMARALMNDPELVLLDEPTTGLDPQARRVVWRTLRALAARGYTLVLTTHYLDEAERLCDRLVLVEHGRVVVEGAPRALVREHVGDAVLELDHGPAGAPPALREALDGAGIEWHEEEDGTLTAYPVGRDAAAAAAALEAIEAPQAVRRETRRGTLEDAFLRITGHALLEGERA